MWSLFANPVTYVQILFVIEVTDRCTLKVMIGRWSSYDTAKSLTCNASFEAIRIHFLQLAFALNIMHMKLWTPLASVREYLS